MKPQETHRRVQGTRLSTLVALYHVSAATFTRLSVSIVLLTYLAISIAPALPGLVQICENTTRDSGFFELIPLFAGIEDGKKRGEEKRRWCGAMKKNLFKAQTVKGTLYDPLARPARLLRFYPPCYCSIAS